MQMKTMKKVRITRERLIAQLRSKSVKNMGSVKRLYIEAGGNFTLISERDEKPGLCLIPDWDYKYNERQQRDKNIKVCCFCGNRQRDANEKSCSNCGEEDKWVDAVVK